MDGVPALYKGRIVSKEHFRVFIYAHDGSQKLIESWDAFEVHMQTGLWFATPDEAAPQKEPEPKKTKSSKAKKHEVSVEEAVKDESDSDDAVFEVTDDFLPKG